MSQPMIHDMLSYACAGLPNSGVVIDDIHAMGAATLGAIHKRVLYARDAIRQLPGEIMSLRVKALAAERGDRVAEAQDATNDADVMQQKLDDLIKVDEVVSSTGCFAEGVMEYSEARFALEPAHEALCALVCLANVVDATQAYAGIRTTKEAEEHIARLPGLLFLLLWVYGIYYGTLPSLSCPEGQETGGGETVAPPGQLARRQPQPLPRAVQQPQQPQQPQSQPPQPPQPKQPQQPQQPRPAQKDIASALEGAIAMMKTMCIQPLPKKPIEKPEDVGSIQDLVKSIQGIHI